MTSLPRFRVNNPLLVNLFMIRFLHGRIYSALTVVRPTFPQSRP